MAVTYNLKGTTNSSFKVGKSGNGTVEIGAIDSTGASGSAASITGHLVPSANVTYDLGSTSNYWRDLYLGPGSLYVNGKKVIEDDSGTITFSTDENQNLSISTSGTGQTTLSSVAGLNLTATSSGDITFTTSTGQINFDGDVIVNAANSINSSNAEPIAFADPISVTGNSTMANLTITGNLTVQGTTTTIDSTTVQIQNAFVFEGATDDAFETTLTVTDPTADRTITLPDATGTVVLADATQTLTNKTLGATTISGHLTPSANVTYDLGSSSNRFRDIYLSGSTIDLGGAKLTNDGSDNLDIKDSSGNRKIIRASAIELVDSSGKKMKLERDATSGKLKQTRKNSDGTDEGSTDTLDIVGDTSPQLGGDLDTNGNNITFGDNDTAYFGTGNDLSIYHDGSHSYIKDVGTGNLWIGSNGEYTALGNNTASEFYIKASNNGAVELYYDNSKKLETTSTGVTVTGTLVADGLTVDTNTLYVDSANNEVGIGTTTPNGKFEVATGGITNTRIEYGTTRAALQFAKSGTVQGALVAETISSNDMIYIGAGASYASNPVLAVDATNQRVGIGTTSPTEELDVVGDGKFSGNVTVTGNLTVNGTTTTVNSTTVEIQNAFVFEGATADDYETTLTVTDPTADRTITLPNATGTVVLQDSTDTLSNKTLASPTVTGNVAFDTDVLFVDATNNRVGVNTSSPADPFVVKQGTGETRFGGTNGRTLSAYDNGTLNNFDFKANQVYFEADLLVNGAKKISTHNGSTQNLYITTSDATKAIYTDRDIITDGDLIFEGATADDYETTLTVTDPTADRTITLPDATGTVALTSDLYTNSDVDAHLNQSNPTSGYVLSWNGSDYVWVAQSSGGSTYTAQSSAPSSPSAGDEWYDTDTGDFYKYINDGTTSQWVEWSPGSGGAQLDGTTEITGTITPGTDNTYALGSSSKKFSAVYSTSFEGTATSAQYADLAEMYAGDQAYEPGTVVVVGGTHEVTQCTKHLDSSLAGVVSEKPGYLMNKDIDAEYPVCVGFVGRVPVKVVGHIEKGDLLTTSSIPGFATKYSKGSYEPGCIIGVALNTKQEIGEGTVEVLLKRS